MTSKWDTTPSHTGRRRIEQILDKNKKGSTTGNTGDDEGNGNTANVKTSDKKKKSTSDIEPDYTKTYTPYVIPVPKERYVEPKAYSLARVGLELYETDEENYKPYVPTGNTNATEEDEEKEDSEDSEEDTNTVEDENAENEDDENLAGFSLHMGEILKIFYHGDCNKISFESNYKDMSDGGSINVDEVDLKNSYKGVRVKLVSEWEEYGKSLKWEDLEQALLGFIIEQTFSDYETEIKLAGMTKTLEINYKFDFKQMLRSEIINQVILTAGLVPCINVEGLDDDITDFTNISSSGSSDDGDMSSTGSATIDEAVKNAIKGKSGCLEKAKAIDKAFKSHVTYQYYYNVHHPDLDEAWKNANLNCADGANILSAMFRAAGIKATILHTTNHYIVRVTCDGKDYYTDNAANSGNHTTRPFGEVYGDDPSTGSEIGAKIAE